MKFKAVLDETSFLELAGKEHFNIAKESLLAYSNGTQAPDLAPEQEKLDWADVVLFFFPLW